MEEKIELRKKDIEEQLIEMIRMRNSLESQLMTLSKDQYSVQGAYSEICKLLDLNPEEEFKKCQLK